MSRPHSGVRIRRKEAEPKSGSTRVVEEITSEVIARDRRRER